MYRFVIFVFGVVVVGIHATDRLNPGVMPACARVAHGGFNCCKKEIPKEPIQDKEVLRECMPVMKKPPNCDLDICIAKKRGVASDDGTINKEALGKYIDEKFEKDPELAESLKENCVNSDLSKFGQADFCDLMKQKICIEVEIVKSCNEWNDEGDCSGMKELAAECIKQFS